VVACSTDVVRRPVLCSGRTVRPLQSTGRRSCCTCDGQRTSPCRLSGVGEHWRQRRAGSRRLDKQVRGRSDIGIPRRQSWNRHAVVLVASGVVAVTGDKVKFDTVDFVESGQSRPWEAGGGGGGGKLSNTTLSPVCTDGRQSRNLMNINEDRLVSYCSLRSIQSRTWHERLCRRRFLAAATAIIVETDAKIISSSAMVSKWRH